MIPRNKPCSSKPTVSLPYDQNCESWKSTSAGPGQVKQTMRPCQSLGLPSLSSTSCFESVRVNGRIIPTRRNCARQPEFISANAKGGGWRRSKAFDIDKRVRPPPFPPPSGSPFLFSCCRKPTLMHSLQKLLGDRI